MERTKSTSYNNASLEVDMQFVPLIHESIELVRQKMPHIFTNLEQLWGSPQFRVYVNNLLIDDRGDRSGFPVDVGRSLLQLSAIHEALHENGSVLPSSFNIERTTERGTFGDDQGDPGIW